MTPCCMSTHTQSNPACAMISAEKPLGIVNHAPSAARSCAHASRNPFVRIAAYRRPRQRGGRNNRDQWSDNGKDFKKRAGSRVASAPGVPLAINEIRLRSQR